MNKIYKFDSTGYTEISENLRDAVKLEIELQNRDSENKVAFYEGEHPELMILNGESVRNKTKEELLSSGVTTQQEYDDDKWSEIRAQRDALLQKCDWTQMPDSPLSSNDKATWASYRQSLRDLPQTYSNWEDVIFPTEP